jgi:negative regulator of sigma-B (phosphoserine phosphatase)
MTAEWPEALQRGVAGAIHAGETRSGDVAVFAPTAAGGLAALIDGLGHGHEAADAAEAAAEILRAHAEEAPEALLARCHEALRGTRGAVMTLVWFDVGRAELVWTGVGNVEARIVQTEPDRPGSADSALVFAGVVGYQLPKVRPSRKALRHGDTVVLATDGVEPLFSDSMELRVDAQVLAERVLARHGRGTDDALVIVVRYLVEDAG